MDLPADVRAKVDAIKARPERRGPNRQRSRIRDTYLEPTRPAEPGTTISQREAEVVELIADGLTNDDVASRLFVSPETVKSHVRHLLFRTGSRNRTHLAVRLVRGELTIV